MEDRCKYLIEGYALFSAGNYWALKTEFKSLKATSVSVSVRADLHDSGVHTLELLFTSCSFLQVSRYFTRGKGGLVLIV